MCHTKIVNRAYTLNSTLDSYLYFKILQPTTIRFHIYIIIIVYFSSLHRFVMFKDICTWDLLLLMPFWPSTQLMRIEFFSQQNDTKIINLDEGVLILWPFFRGNVIFKICHFCLKSHNWRTANFHCLAPRVKCLLFALKNEDSMNKEKHSLRNFAVLQSRGSYSKKFLPTSIVTFDRKEASFENDIASEKWL